MRATWAACGVGCTTVLEYGYRAKAARIGWPLPEGMSDAELEALLFPPSPPSNTDRPLPDWKHVKAELSKKGVTMTLVWQEYLQENPTGYRYSRFVEMYREWEGKHSYTMVQGHRPGEKLFVDFSGMKMKVTDPRSGIAEEVEIFVAATGFSQYIFVHVSEWNAGAQTTLVWDGQDYLEGRF